MLDLAGLLPFVPAAGVRALRHADEVGKIANALPKPGLRMARVVPAQYASSPTLAAPSANEAFVTLAEDIAGIDTAQGLAQRLTLVDEAGNLLPGPFAVFEFDPIFEGLASPISRTNPGFVGSGRTAGGAREFVIPNLSVNELTNLVTRIFE